jgi:radical SAM superfamily enzyme YgiQ (UPF0313 family)
MYKVKDPEIVFQYEIDIGCNKRCNFCIRYKESIYQHKNPENIVNDIRYLIKNYKTKLISIITNAINIDKKFMISLCQELYKNKLPVFWYSYAIPMNLKSSDFGNLYKSGCRLLRYGVESGSEKVQKSMKKNFKVEEIENILYNSHKSGIWNQVNFIVGYPYEDISDIQETISFIKRNSDYIDSIRINPFYFQKSSLVFDEYKKLGITLRDQKNGVIGYDEDDGISWGERCQFTKKFINESFEAIRWRLYHQNDYDKKYFKNNWDSLLGLTFETDV